MDPKMFDLSMTGVYYGVSISSTGLDFSFDGFAPLMPQLIDRVLQEFDAGLNVTRDKKRYERIMVELNESLHTYTSMPVQYAIADRNRLIEPGSHSNEELLEALKHLSLDSVASSKEELLLTQPLQVDSLAMGNIPSNEANSALAKVLERSNSWPGAAVNPPEGARVVHVRPIVKIPEPVELRKLNPRKGDNNEVVIVSIMLGEATLQSRVLMGLLSQMLRSVAFLKLRTDMQLGYVVNGGISKISNVQVISCAVQGDVMKADEMEAAVENVLTGIMPQKLKNLTDKDFQLYKSSFHNEILSPPGDHNVEFDNFWTPVSQGGQCFNIRENLLRVLEGDAITKESMAKAWNDAVLPASGERRKLVVKYFSGAQVPPRPTQEVAEQLWKTHSVPAAATEMLKKEFAKTKVLAKADTQARKSLAEQGGFFSTAVNCELEQKAQLVQTQQGKVVRQSTLTTD
jgi:secreted Zn-dependent insulinase-like peptidase